MKTVIPRIMHLRLDGTWLTGFPGARVGRSLGFSAAPISRPVLRAARTLRRLIIEAITVFLTFSSLVFAQEQRVDISVAADQAWVDSGLDVLRGDMLVIGAAGEWSNGGGKPQFVDPNGFGNYRMANTQMPDAPLGKLIGRIGDTQFEVGRAYKNGAPASGRLFLGMNDVPETFGDNVGRLGAYAIRVPAPVPLPNFLGMSYEQAANWLTQRELDAYRETDSSDREPGTIFDQNPEPGTDVRTIRGVTLNVSSGPPLLVPDVVGLREFDARDLLEQVELSARSRGQEASPLKVGRVTRTNPPEGTRAKAGLVVDYWLSSGPPSPLRMPNLVGLREAVAVSELTGFGIGATRGGEEVSSLEAGTVARTDPEAGGAIDRSTIARYWISSGQPLLMPNLIGLSESEAKARLAQIQLGARRRGQDVSSFAQGQVARTEPLAGSSVTAGLVVGYWLSSGTPPVRSPRMPNLVGLKESVAASQLSELGIRAMRISEEESPLEPGTVTRTYPAAGDVIGPQARASYWLSSGPPPPIKMPNLLGLGEDEALMRLAEFPLQGQRAGEEKSSLEEGSISRTVPPQGIEVKSGAVIRYWVSSGDGPPWIWLIGGAGAVALLAGAGIALKRWPPSPPLAAIDIKPSLDMDSETRLPHEIPVAAPAVSLRGSLEIGDVSWDGPAPIAKGQITK